MSRDEIEQGLRDCLGAERMVWLGQGLAEDKDTDGHVDLVVARSSAPGRVLLQPCPPGHPDYGASPENLRA